MPEVETQAPTCQFEWSAWFGYGETEYHLCGAPAFLIRTYGQSEFDKAALAEAGPDTDVVVGEDEDGTLIFGKASEVYGPTEFALCKAHRDEDFDDEGPYGAPLISTRVL